MLKSRAFLVLFAAATLLLGGVGCSDSDSSEEPAKNNQPDASTTDTENTNLEPLPEGWTFESEYSLRFTKFALDDDSPGSDLNGIIQPHIDDQSRPYPVVVLMHFKNIDPASKTLDLRGGAGMKADIDCIPEEDGVCDYKWDPSTSAAYTVGSTFDPATGELNAALDSLEFITTFESGEDVLKSSIPITNLTLVGQLVPESSDADSGEVVIKYATLEGYVTGEDAKNSSILLANNVSFSLYDLLQEEKMNADLDEDGQKDAWHLTGTFAAIETTIVD